MRAVVRNFSIGILLFVGGCGLEHDPVVSLFRHWVIDPNPNTGKDCCTDVLILGDLNGDGAQDVIVGAEHAEGTSLVWYQYPTWEKHAVGTGEFTTDGQAVDLDRDGDLDIVISNYSPGAEAILWFENSSGTGQGKWIQHTIGKGFGHDVEVGDMDGDGDIDVVTCDKKKVVLWEQVTPVSFKGQVILERKGEGVALADIDRDGDLDIVYGGSWLENPGSLSGEKWIAHMIVKEWSPDTRVSVADMNGDGRPDVVLTVSEGTGAVSWFESPDDPKSRPWVEHPVEREMLEGAHSVQVADIDSDGDLDVVTAEMHTSGEKRVLVYLSEGGAFRAALLARSGSHNMRVSDFDNDGDYDIFGKNYAGSDRVIEMWENQISEKKKWVYTSIDADRPKHQREKMGLCFTDADGDGFTDVVAGSFLYHNPGGNLQAKWSRTELADDIDVFFPVDIDMDRRSDLVGIAGDTIVWLEASDEKAVSWEGRPIGKVPAGRTQGYVKAKLRLGEKPQLVFTRGKNLYILEIPDRPEQSRWPLHRISTETEEEGIAMGDIDHDGDLDIAAVKADGQHAIWLENPGDNSTNWKMHLVGESQPWMDRIALADINGDGRSDFIATVERQDGTLADSLYWYEGPSSPKQEPWRRHIIARHRSLNSMDIADVDGDGVVDIVVAEHTDLKDNDGAADNLTLIYLNKDDGRHWVPQVVERGPHSSHLGARFVDLENDGIMEIVSIGWNQYQHVHLWSKTLHGHTD